MIVDVPDHTMVLGGPCINVSSSNGQTYVNGKYVQANTYYISLYGGSYGDVMTCGSNGPTWMPPIKPKSWLDMAMEEAAGNEQLTKVLEEIIEKFKEFQMLRKLQNE